MPPHWPYKLLQVPPPPPLVGVTTTEDVVVVGGFVVPPPPPPDIFTVTTLRPGRFTVTDPPDTLAEVDANWWLLSVKYADAELGVKPLNERVPDC